MHKPFDYERYKPALCDSTGKKLTAGLFEELADPATAAKPVFKLSDWRKTYVEIADPTDYQAAMVLIGNWEHWLALMKCPGFVEELEKWKEEVDTKLKSEAVSELIKQSKTDKGTAAARWLAEHGYVDKKRGRPAKKKEEAGDDSKRLREDANRLKVVK